MPWLLVTDLRGSYRAKLEAKKPMDLALATLANARAAHTTLQAGLVQQERELQCLTALAAKLPLLEAAREGLAQATRDIATLAEEEAVRQTRHTRDLVDVESQATAVQRELTTLATEDVTGKLAQLDRQVTASREAVAALVARIEALIRQQSTLAAEVERLEAELAGLPAAQGRAQALSDRIAVWKLLAKERPDIVRCRGVLSFVGGHVMGANHRRGMGGLGEPLPAKAHRNR